MERDPVVEEPMLIFRARCTELPDVPHAGMLYSLRPQSERLLRGHADCKEVLFDRVS
jgi:hypothetical protein